VTATVPPADGGLGPLLLPTDGAQVVEVTGEDRLTHLDAMTTQALKDARPGTATAALLLGPHGDPQAMFDVLVLPDRVWLVTPAPDVTDAVMTVIAGRTFLADARFRVLDHRVARAAVAPDLLRRAWSGTAVAPEVGTVRTTPSGDVAVALDVAGAITVAGPAAEVEDLQQRLRDAGATDADATTVDAWRVATGRPAWGVEVAPPHLPEELGLLPTHVHLAKGCYPGQEAVARMWMLGRPRRRLAQVRIEGPGAVAIRPGWTAGEGRDVVTVTTVAGAAALAFVPATAAAGDRLPAAVDGAVTVEVVGAVGDDPIPPGHDPAMRRRRDRDRDAGR
jgi:tRNA-modifying protein YgfZ